MSGQDHSLFDRRLLALRRERRAGSLAEHDFLIHRAADDLVERLAFIKRAFPVVLDLGSGHGVLARRLRTALPASLVIAADMAPGPLRLCPAPLVVADEELLPFADASLDLVASALSLQLVNDLPGTLVQARRALKPDGLFLAALLGGATLAELREALVAAETEIQGGASPRVAPFADVRVLGHLLQRAGFALPVADSDIVEVGYPSALELMRDLRGLGWANMLVARRRSGLGRRTLMRALEIYAERFSRPDGRVRATFEIVTLTGWAPAASQPKPLRPGSATARLADALGTQERPAEPPES